ncbi:MAG: rod shape-determining protein MreD [Bacteroidaceae bacterium]|nr:rod shape-determining protein MreD [Bacteroidaceae bacterium]
MKLAVIKRLGLFFIWILLQVVLFNTINLFGYATPFLYIYPFICFNTQMSKNEQLLWAFFVGLAIDLFANTPGVNAAATLVLVFFRLPILHLYTPHDSWEDVMPSVYSIGHIPFLKYLISLVLLHHLVLFSLDAFSFINISLLLTKWLVSSMFTILCLWGISSVERR